MNEKLSLRTPANADQEASFNTRRRAVRQWVHNLPVANLAELSHRLHDALKRVNAQRNSTGRLFHFLEAIGPAASLVLADLQNQYAYQPLPLNDAGTRAAHLAVELITEMLRGYRTVLRAIVPDKEAASHWRLFLYRRELVTTLHRFIRYGDRLLETYRLLHMDPPEKVWKRINRCYLLAEAHHLATRRVPRCNDKGVRTSISHEYKGLLLSALLPPGAVIPQQQREIAETLGRWIKLVTLTSPSTEKAEGHYAVRIARDLGPLDIAELSADAMKSRNTRLLDTRALCAQITQLRERGGKGRWWRREKDVDPAILTLLHDHWCLAHHRGEVRESVNLPAELAVGLGALFHLTGGKATRESKAATNEIMLEALPESGGHWHGKSKQTDVWERIYPNASKPKTTPPQGAVPTPRVDPNYTAIPGRILDKSQHGLAFIVERTALHQAAIGMPAAIRPDGESEWQIGTVMRIKNRGDAVELGIRILLHGALPARLRTREGVRVSPPFDVVLGRTLDLQRGVAAPAVSALRSGNPEIEIAGTVLAARRGIVLAHSRYMDAFVIDVEDSVALAQLEEKARTATAQNPSAIKAPSNTAATATTEAAPLSREERIAKLMTETGLPRADAEFVVDQES